MSAENPLTVEEVMAAGKPGDTFQIEGVHPYVPNPGRKWWQFWKPRVIIDRSRLQTFIVL